MAETRGTFELDRLRASVKRAERARQIEGAWSSAPIEFHLDAGGWAEVASLLRFIERWRASSLSDVRHPHDFASVLLEQLVVDPDLSDLDVLLKRTEEVVRGSAQLLVSVLLGNLTLSAVVQIDAETLIVPAVKPGDGQAWSLVRSEIESHFKDALQPPAAVDPEDPGRLVDEVGVGAAVLSLEQSERGLARHRALTRARHAVACWCLCFSPAEQNNGFTLWPTATEWFPQPFAQHELAVKPHEPGIRSFDRSRPDGAVMIYGPYQPPDDVDVLRAPWGAARAAAESHCARALLSAAWHLYVASSTPSVLHLTDRALHLNAALNALVTPPPSLLGSRGGAEDRWQRLAANLDVWTDLQRDGFDVSETERNQDRVSAIRNLTMHAAESYSLSYGLRPMSTRRRGVSAAEIAPALQRSDLGLMLLAVEDAARKLFTEARSNGWDSQAYAKWLE